MLNIIIIVYLIVSYGINTSIIREKKEADSLDLLMLIFSPISFGIILVMIIKDIILAYIATNRERSKQYYHDED